MSLSHSQCLRLKLWGPVGGLLGKFPDWIDDTAVVGEGTPEKHAVAGPPLSCSMMAKMIFPEAEAVAIVVDCVCVYWLTSGEARKSVGPAHTDNRVIKLL